jgi:hypothetical protein
MTTKSHPLIREIQLGRPIESICEQLYEEFDFQVVDNLEGVIKELIRMNDPNARFAVFTKDDNCYITLLNNKESYEWPRDMDFNYWDDEGYARSDDADLDCEQLNKAVRRLFGTKDKPGNKMTKEQFLKKKGKCCPHCGVSKVVTLDDFVTWRTNKVMGCSKCGKTWMINYEMKIKGYE